VLCKTSGHQFVCEPESSNIIMVKVAAKRVEVRVTSDVRFDCRFRESTMHATLAGASWRHQVSRATSCPSQLAASTLTKSNTRTYLLPSQTTRCTQGKPPPPSPFLSPSFRNPPRQVRRPSSGQLRRRCGEAPFRSPSPRTARRFEQPSKGSLPCASMKRAGRTFTGTCHKSRARRSSSRRCASVTTWCFATTRTPWLSTKRRLPAPALTGICGSTPRLPIASGISMSAGDSV
jgi:hypothetical protein